MGYNNSYMRLYSKGQMNLPFIIKLARAHAISERKLRFLHAAEKIAGNVIRKRFLTFPMMGEL